LVIKDNDIKGKDINGKHTATHCNTLQHTATHCNTLNGKHIRQLTIAIQLLVLYKTHQATLQQNAIHCNRLTIAIPLVVLYKTRTSLDHV